VSSLAMAPPPGPARRHRTWRSVGLPGRPRLARRETEAMSFHVADRLHTVVAGLLVDADMVFLCHRSAGRRWYPNVWDLPGGHIEENERPPRALVRELREELGVVIPEPTDPPFVHLRHPDFDCRIWVVREWTGRLHLASDEHDDLAWWHPDAIADLPLAVEDYRSLLRRAVAHRES
jgi:8-oxo-dGTP diphosphatase